MAQMHDYDQVNPWPAIRELQDITRDLNGDLKELKERLEILTDWVKKIRSNIEVIEEVVYRLEGK